MSAVAKGYIDATWAIDSARQRGMDLDDFVESWLDGEDRQHRLLEAGVGHTQKTTDWLLSQATLPHATQCVEIGPGPGRYYAALLRQRPDAKVLFYEPNEGWQQWLRTRFSAEQATLCACDGKSLADTTSASIDLCAAHGVFVYLDTMISFSYLKESARCLKPRGYLFFDIMDMDREDIVELIEAKMVDCPYMIPLSGKVVRRYLAKLGLKFVSYFMVGGIHDMTTYLLFQKDKAAAGD
jgi:SAM-dependent methyltransferase